MYFYIDYRNTVTGEVNEGNNVHGPDSLRWAPKTIVVRGTFQYYDSTWGGGTTTSTYCNDIHLYEWDPTKVDTLGAVAAQWETNKFEFSAVVNEDDTDHGFLDLFVRVNYRSNEACWNSQYPNNWFVSIRTPQDSLWHFDVAGITDVNVVGDTLNLGIIAPSSYGHRSALHILKTISHRGWGLVRSHTPSAVRIPEVRVKYQPGYNHSTAWAKPDTLFVNGTDNIAGFYPDEWDDAVLLHEYAHHVAWIDSFIISAAPPPTYFHSPWGNSDTDTTAWQEGWGHFFGALRGADPFTPEYGYYSDYGRGAGGAQSRILMDLENDTVTVYSPNLSTVSAAATLFARGARWEGSVAGALWDLYDDVNDRQKPTALGDSLSEGFGNIFASLAQTPPIRFEEVHHFLREYEKRFLNDNRKHQLLRRIFMDHGISAGRDSFALTGVEELEQLHGPLVRLIGAVPNPLNPNTRIRYFVRDEKLPGRLSIRIFDPRGRLVRVLRPERVTRGVNELVWDGTSEARHPVASGVYFYELECGSVRNSAKLTILR